MREQGHLERDSNPELCDAGAELYHLSYQANWEEAFFRVHVKPVIVFLYLYDVKNT